MKTKILCILFIGICLLISRWEAYAQVQSLGPNRNYNFSGFSKIQKEINQELTQLTPENFLTHPEFGTLQYGAPCTDCYELIHKRTPNSKYFVDKNSSGQLFSLVTSYNDLHYKNEKGELLTIDPRLKPSSENNHIFYANQQLNPTRLDIESHFAAIQITPEFEYQFNQFFSLNTSDGNKKINNTHVTVGEDGCIYENAWDGIEMKELFGKGSVESIFTIYNLNSIDIESDYTIIEEIINIPSNYSLEYDLYEGEFISNELWNGELVINDEFGREIIRYSGLTLNDNSLDSSQYSGFESNLIGYKIKKEDDKWLLQIYLNNEWLTSETRIFPVVIDPFVTASTVWSGSNGSAFTPNYCPLTFDITLPANSTFTNCTVNHTIRTGNACTNTCWLSDVRITYVTTCASSGYWTCLGCDLGGMWTPATGTSIPALVTCFPPSCVDQVVPFEVQMLRVYCGGATPAACTTTCLRITDQSVIVEGRTVEVTALAEGATAYTVVNCADQSGYLSASTPNYGVPGYTYTWTPGPLTGSPVFVIFPMGVTVYTLTITDACGNTATDNVTVTNNCLLLPIDLLSFSGYNHDKKNYLNWVTASEKNNSGFIIERSPTGLQFEPIGSVDGNGNSQQNSNYGFIDNDPFEGVNYYRLKQVDENEEFSYSNIIAINSGEVTNTHVIVNNEKFEENILDLTIFSTTAGQSDIFIYDLTGAAVASHKLYVGAGANTVNLQVPSLAKGVYILSFVRGVETAETKFIY